MQLGFDFTGSRELRGVLGHLRANGEDPRPALRGVADYFTDQNAAALRTSGRAIGVRWKPLSADYRSRRRAGPVGVQTGVLRASLTQQQARSSRTKITRDMAQVASGARHAHLFDKGRKGQPARPLVNIRRSDRKAIAGILQRHLTGHL